MKFAYPQMRPTWQFMPFMPTYQSSLPIYLFQLQTGLQCNATPMQLGMRTFVTPYVPLLIPQHEQYHALDADRHHNQAHQLERGQDKTAAPTNNQDLHASFGTMTNDRRAISHHKRVGEAYNARSGLVGGPPSSGSSATPNQKTRSRAALQNRGKRASVARGQRKCDDLWQYVVANEGTESGRPWKRRRTGGQPTANIPVQFAPMSPPPSVASTPISTLAVADEITEATRSTNAPGGDIPTAESGMS